MKTLLLICVCATSLAVSSASLIDALKAVHNSPAFHNLTHEDQILVIELVAETEAGELKAFVDTVGFHKVLAVIDSKFTRSDAGKSFNQICRPTDMLPLNFTFK